MSISPEEVHKNWHLGQLSPRGNVRQFPLRRIDASQGGASLRSCSSIALANSNRPGTSFCIYALYRPIRRVRDQDWSGLDPGARALPFGASSTSDFFMAETTTAETL